MEKTNLDGEAFAPSRFKLFQNLVNYFPHPATAFAILAVLTVIFSSVAASFDISVINPATQEIVRPVNLLNTEGLHRILGSFTANVSNFTPFGAVLVAMLGIAVAEGSGLTHTLIKFLVSAAPARLVTASLVFAGIISHTFGDVGFLILVPLAPLAFKAAGKHPVAGLVAAYAAVSGGFCANVALGVVDPLLAGVTQQAAQTVAPAYQVNPAVNYYFMFACAICLLIVTTVVNEKITVKQLGDYDSIAEIEVQNGLSRDEKRGLLFALITGLIFLAAVLYGTVPPNGFLRDPDTGSLLQSPFMTGIIALLFVGSAAVGIAYGIGAKTFRNDRDVVDGMARSLQDIGGYFVIVFFALQYITLFNWTNLGLIFAIGSARGLESWGIQGIPLIIMFVVLTLLVDVLVSSAFAKWSIMAPIFVPMFMMLGYSPELVQMAYRIGDSLTNLISPFLAFIPFVLIIAQRYNPKIGMGGFFKLMFPYFVSYLFITVFLLVGWIIFDLPLGPGGTVYYKP